MKNSDRSSDRQSSLLPRWLIWSMAIVAFLGFLDASYLTIAHYTGLELNCSILKGCEQVTTSKYATILGFPVALLGLLYYVSILLLTLIYFDSKNRFILKLIPPLTLAAFLASVWFVYLQIFVIKAICQYCMFSAITSTTLFVFGIFVWKKARHKHIA